MQQNDEGAAATTTTTTALPQQQQQEFSNPTAFHNPARTYACSLNNIGVELMRLGEFQAAVNVLDNALAVMFQSQQQQQQQQPHNNNGGLHQNTVLLFAQERLMNASMALSRFTAPQPYMAQLRVHAVESNDLATLKNASLDPQEAASLMSYSAVVIRDVSATATCAATSSNHRIDFDRESAICLYNYGLSNYLVAVLTQQVPETDDAVQSLMYAHATLSNILLECEDASEDLDSVFLSMLVLTSLGKLFHSRHDEDAATEAQEAAGTLFAAVQDETRLCPLNNDLLTAAAA
mmetsp:Transcript_4039/g.8823  ORF Transcript_4039/g.8823 Transcript_4039/m.8823 type:complete len:292 (+) Transcript_4039:101-976(+)